MEDGIDQLFAEYNRRRDEVRTHAADSGPAAEGQPPALETKADELDQQLEAIECQLVGRLYQRGDSKAEMAELLGTNIETIETAHSLWNSGD